MFSWYKYLIVNLVFSHLGFWSGNLFLIAPFPDLYLLVLLCYSTTVHAINTDGTQFHDDFLTMAFFHTLKQTDQPWLLLTFEQPYKFQCQGGKTFLFEKLNIVV